MTDARNLDAYLARIDWQGERVPTYATLAGVLNAHVAHIPFENFDVLLGRPRSGNHKGGSGARLELRIIRIHTKAAQVPHPSTSTSRADARKG